MAFAIIYSFFFLTHTTRHTHTHYAVVIFRQNVLQSIDVSFSTFSLAQTFAECGHYCKALTELDISGVHLSQVDTDKEYSVFSQFIVELPQSMQLNCGHGKLPWVIFTLLICRLSDRGHCSLLRRSGQWAFGARPGPPSY